VNAVGAARLQVSLFVSESGSCSAVSHLHFAFSALEPCCARLAQMLFFSCLRLFLHWIWVEFGFSFVSSFSRRKGAWFNMCLCIILRYFSSTTVPDVKATRASCCASEVPWYRCWAMGKTKRDHVLGWAWEDNWGPFELKVFLWLIPEYLPFWSWAQETPFGHQPFLEQLFRSSLLLLCFCRAELGGGMVGRITYLAAAPLNCCWLYFSPCHYLPLTLPSPPPLSIC